MGERYAVDREGVAYLEGVEVTVFREEGGTYEIEASQAREENNAAYFERNAAWSDESAAFAIEHARLLANGMQEFIFRLKG